MKFFRPGRVNCVNKRGKYLNGPSGNVMQVKQLVEQVQTFVKETCDLSTEIRSSVLEFGGQRLFTQTRYWQSAAWRVETGNLT